MMIISRQAAITRLVRMLDEVYSQDSDFISKVVLEGRVGLNDMTDAEIENELDAHWPEEDFKVVP